MRNLGFIKGFLVCLALGSLYQDIIGKAAYIAHVQNHWIDGSITVPLALIAIVWVVFYKPNKKDPKDD